MTQQDEQRSRRKIRLRVLFHLGCGSGRLRQFLPRQAAFALFAILALTAPSVHATTATPATLYWGNMMEDNGSMYSVGHGSREEAALAAVALYCAIPANASFLTSCAFGGFSATDPNQIILVTNYGAFDKILYVFQFYACPKGTQFNSTWPGYTTPACVIWAEPPSSTRPPPKVIVIDPGHGLNCRSAGRPPGAIDVTDFAANDPPPGKLREDDLTMAMALEVQRTLPSSKYKVVLTKNDVDSCPSYWDRGQIALNAKAKAFVSLHVNAPNVILGIDIPLGNGTSVLYNSSNRPSKTLADIMASSVSSNLGVNNRGPTVRDDIAVLNPRITTMDSVLVEAARLSGSDEKILHTAGSVSRIATGVRSALDAFFGN